MSRNEWKFWKELSKSLKNTKTQVIYNQRNSRWPCLTIKMNWIVNEWQDDCPNIRKGTMESLYEKPLLSSKWRKKKAQIIKTTSQALFPLMKIPYFPNWKIQVSPQTLFKILWTSQNNTWWSKNAKNESNLSLRTKAKIQWRPLLWRKRTTLSRNGTCCSNIEFKKL